MPLTTNTALQIKINDNWVSIPSLVGPSGPAGPIGPTGASGPTGGTGFNYTDLSISVSDWNNSTTCTKQVPGITAQSHVIVSADGASMPAIIANTIYCSSQGNGTLTFTCSTVPSTAVVFEVMYAL